tara:strand:+ start:98 stop:616 length:519 start_codon:yes stop_codon:yes gene_type:complete
MGFDLYGVNPKQNTNKPEILTSKFSWELEESEHKSYWKAQDKYEDENRGVYFRRNVWGWRPLWDFVYSICDNILTQKDYEFGHYNDGHKISKTKAIRIAKRIARADKEGVIQSLEQEYNIKRDEAKSYNAQWKETIKQEPQLRDWTAHYPFERESLLDFMKFCEESGGFTIC